MTSDKKNSGVQKLKSAKLWIAIWAVSMVTFIVIADRSAYITIAQWLCGVVLTYFGVNVVQKKIFSDADKKKDGNMGEVFDTLFPNDGKGEGSADTQKEGQ